MTRRRWGRIVFGVGFVVLLFDGAAAVWLGQLSGRGVMVAAGVAILAAAGGLVFVWHRWQEALDAVDAARDDLHRAIRDLRDAADEARQDR
jgi:hypothetical protein